MIPTDLGLKIVEEFDATKLKKYFEIPYTASMEDDLDLISKSKLE